MNARLLAELSSLFSLEALEADRCGDVEEADRLWGVADELHSRFERADLEANGMAK